MPPKSLPPRRITRSTAGKAVPPTVPSQCATNPKTSSSTSSSQDTRVAPPPPSTAATAARATARARARARSASELPLNDACLLTSSDNEGSNPKIENSSHSVESSAPIINSNPQPQAKIKKSGKKIRVGDEVQERVVLNSGPVLRRCNAPVTTLVRPKSTAAGGAGDELEGSNGGGSSFEGETAPGSLVVADAGLEVKGKGGDEVLAEVDKAAAIEDGGSAKVGEGRTRKVVKKTVRIVKKIVKRKVPKRVVKGSVRTEETERVENGGELKEGNERLELETNESVSMEVEKVDSNGTVEKVDFDGIVEKVDCNGTVGIEEKSATNVGIFKETDESLELAMNELNSMEADSTDTVIKTEENSKPNDAVVLEVENEDLKDKQGQEAKEITKINPSAETIVKGEDVEELGDSTSESSLQGLSFDENDGNEGLIVEDQLENENVNFAEMKRGDCFEDQSAGHIQERTQDGEEVVKELVEKNDVGLNRGLALSGEMEALERRKRRRTEIFIGGLDKDTKEEDIRKLFEQVGEVTQVRLVMNSNSGKNKGFAFLRFASATDAKKALEKYSTVEIRGKQCGVRPVEGNDTIFLGNINKKWKSKDVVELLKVAKIQNIDKVTVMANPNNLEQNRGFAFLEFQTTKDAQIAFSKLQKYDVFIKQLKIKVAWAQPLIEPNEEEMLKVKSVYAEYLPSSWDEAKVRDFFKRFGEIESITLARNLLSSRRKDFAFVNYTTREAALTCIDAFAHEQLDDASSKVKVKVSLAKPLTKAKQPKHVSSTSAKEYVKEKQMASLPITKVREPVKIGKRASNNLEGIRVDRLSSTTGELLQLLRQQARVGPPQPGSSDLNYHYASVGNKRSFSALGSHPISLDPRGFPQSRFESSYSYGSSSHVGMVSYPNFQRQRTGYTLESSHGFEKDPQFEAREQTAYFFRGGGGGGSSVGGGGMYRRY